MTFGQIIKKLRREADMTQEKLAELLSVSAQAVSRWENDSAMPDIALLVPLANLFHVTTDYLLGVDISKREQIIGDIRKEADGYSSRGYYEKARDILEDGLRQYPENYALMHDLLYVSDSQYDQAKQSEAEEQRALAQEYRNEILRLGESLLAGCTDDLFRHDATQLLCYAYKDAGNMEKALKLAESMPYMCVSREFLLSAVKDGTERFRAKQRKIYMLLQFLDNDLCFPNAKLDSGEYAYTDEMQATIREKSVALLHLLFENGDFGFFHSSLSYTHTLLAEHYASIGETRAALDHLQNAAKHAIRFLEQCENKEEHTSLLFIGFEDGAFSTGNTDNTAAEVLCAMQENVFDGIRNTDAFTAVKEELAAYAGKWKV